MRITILDDNDLWASSLANALDKESYEASVVDAYVDDKDEFPQVHSILSFDPEVAIVDLRLPPTWSDEGIRVAQELRSIRPALGIIILSGYEVDIQNFYASQFLETSGPGGSAYLFKDRINRHSLAAAIRSVADGGIVVDPTLLKNVSEQLDDEQRMSGLTEREAAVLKYMAEGRSNAAIAESLGLSVRTVDTHMTNIFRRLEIPATDDVNRRVAAVLRYIGRFEN